MESKADRVIGGLLNLSYPSQYLEDIMKFIYSIIEWSRLFIFYRSIILTNEQCNFRWINITKNSQGLRADIRNDIKEWLDNNDIQYKFFEPTRRLIFIDNDEAVLFQLTWAE